jgi:Xaa-Pro aminopeptidase
VETLQPILKRGRNVWDQINMPKQEFLQRVERIRLKMESEGLDVLLLYGDIHDYGDSCYISNFLVRLPAGALVVLPRTGEPTLFFVGSSRELKLGQRVTWIDDIRSSLAGAFSSTGSLAGDCVNYLKEKGYGSSKIGMAGLRQFMSHGEFQRLTEGVQESEFVDAGHIVRNMRMIKSARECDQIRRAARIVRNTLDAIPGMVLPKMDEWSLEIKIDWAARIQGPDDVRILLGRPKEAGWALRPDGDSVLTNEAAIIVYLAVSFEQYWAEAARTFVVENGNLQETESEKVIGLYRQIAAAMKPGKPAAQFCREAIEEIRAKAGGYISDYGLGDGVGLSSSEAPFLDGKDTTPFGEGMCLSLRMTIPDEKTGSIMIGNTICLTDAGAEVIT